MSDQNNIDLVRNELTTFDTLCQHYQEEHMNLYHALETAEEKDQSSLAFSLKESESFEFKKQVVQWLMVCEQCINDQLDHLNEQRSRASHSSRPSRSSRRSHASKSSRLSAAEERAKVAELLAERSMLSKKLEIQQAEEQFNLDLKIAKAQARNRATETKGVRCLLCHESHDIEECEGFKRKSVGERKAFLTEQSLCFGCYGQNHFSRQCRRKRVCKRCKGPHPTLLHEEGFARRKEVSSGR